MKITSEYSKTIIDLLDEQQPEGSTLEEQLWLAVIQQAIFDLSIPTSTTAKSAGIFARMKINQVDQDSAMNFIFGKSNFCTICLTAGIDPEWLRKLVSCAIEESMTEVERIVQKHRNWCAENRVLETINEVQRG